MRCLFVGWNDGTAPSQFTVPDDYSLPTDGNGLPARLTVFDDDAQTELYLDLSLVKSAYLVNVGADQRIVETAA